MAVAILNTAALINWLIIHVMWCHMMSSSQLGTYSGGRVPQVRTRPGDWIGRIPLHLRPLHHPTVWGSHSTHRVFSRQTSFTGLAGKTRGSRGCRSQHKFCLSMCTLILRVYLHCSTGVQQPQEDLTKSLGCLVETLQMILHTFRHNGAKFQFYLYGIAHF